MVKPIQAWNAVIWGCERVCDPLIPILVAGHDVIRTWQGNTQTNVGKAVYNRNKPLMHCKMLDGLLLLCIPTYTNIPGGFGKLLKHPVFF